MQQEMFEAGREQPGELGSGTDRGVDPVGTFLERADHHLRRVVG